MTLEKLPSRHEVEGFVQTSKALLFTWPTSAAMGVHAAQEWPDGRGGEKGLQNS